MYCELDELEDNFLSKNYFEYEDHLRKLDVKLLKLAHEVLSTLIRRATPDKEYKLKALLKLVIKELVSR
jgi:hypothetical protein